MTSEDNYANAIEFVGDLRNSVLVNVGTVNQISVGLKRYIPARRMDNCPLAGYQYIFAGVGLCGGRAYVALEK